jgi:hypothetical protein
LIGLLSDCWKALPAEFDPEDVDFGSGGKHRRRTGGAETAMFWTVDNPILKVSIPTLNGKL